MVSRIQRRMASEGGFTLIELLVVMIIIAILMAVAIPVFLGQKQKALATNAKENAKHVEDTVESCGAGTQNGEIYDPGPPLVNCALAANLIMEEPSLTSILTGTSCGGALCVTVVGGGAANPDLYTISSRTNSSGTAGFATFILTRSGTGVDKTCIASTPQAKQRMCPNGKW